MRRKMYTVVIIISLLIVSFGVNAIKIDEKPNMSALQSNGGDIDYAEGELIICLNTGELLKEGDEDPIEEFEILRAFSDLEIYVVEVPVGQEITLISNYEEKGAVYATLNYHNFKNASSRPNDPGFDAQWGPKRIKCPDAWDTTTGNPSIKIAIIDTGVDKDHPDLKDKIVDEKNFVNSILNPKADDDNCHGTHCAGIAAAKGNNNEGIAGVAYDCKIMPVKVLDEEGAGYLDDIVAGIIYAADNGADVISMSFGINVEYYGIPISELSALEDACNYAWNKNCVLVAAAGNDNGFGKDTYPAGYNNVIAVTSCDQSDNHIDTKYGRWVDFAAPGNFVYSTMPTEQTKEMKNYGLDTEYDFLQGTSMACPHVAGVAALAISRYPGKNNQEIRDLLNSSADRLSNPWWYDSTGRIGHGRIDATLQEEPFQTNPYLNITIHKIVEDDCIDIGTQPEWYYKLAIRDQGDEEQDLYNYNAEVDGNDPENKSKMDWNPESVWVPDIKHSFEIYVYQSYMSRHSSADIDIKLMDYDGFWEGNKSDLADIAGFTGDGKNDDVSIDHYTAMYEDCYDIYDDSFMLPNRIEVKNLQDEEYGGEYWNVTSGDYAPDNSVDVTGCILPDSENDAEVWFKVEDSYDADKYKPALYVDGSISFKINKNNNSAYLEIKNSALEDPYWISYQLGIKEDISIDCDWLEIKPMTDPWDQFSNEGVEKINDGIIGQQSHTLQLVVDDEKFDREESKTATITIKPCIVEPRGKFKEDLPVETVQVTVTKEKVKSKNCVQSWQTSLQDIFLRYKNFNLKDIFCLFIKDILDIKLYKK